MRKLALILGLMAGTAQATGIEIQVAGQANGTITIDLFEDVAPQHAERIARLASEGAYDGVVFHRVIEGFMAQTGDVEYGKMGGNLSYAGRGGSAIPTYLLNFRMCPMIVALWAWPVRRAQTAQIASSLSCLNPVIS